MQHAVRDIVFFADSCAADSVSITFAIELARLHGATLTLVSVTETADASLLHSRVGQDLARMLADDKLRRLHDMETLAQATISADRVRRVVLEGEVGWHRLTQFVVQLPPDLVITEAQGGRNPGAFGSVSQHLFRKCPVPVWSIPATLQDFPTRALIALHPGATSSDDRLLSRELLRLAVILTAGTGIELHVGHAWDLWGERIIESKYGQHGTRPLLAVQQEYAHETMEQLLAESRCKELLTEIHYVKGEPSEAIPKLAEGIGAGVTILGSAARRGLEGFLIGSVAESIIERLQCSALMIKRGGFVSPVHVA